MRFARGLLVGVLVGGAWPAPAGAQAPPPELALACRADVRQAQVGDDVTLTCTLTNRAEAGEPLDVQPLVLDFRAVSLTVVWTEKSAAKQGEAVTTSEHSYSLVHYTGVRHPAAPLATSALGPGESITGTLTLPCVRTGDLLVRASYRGYAMAPELPIWSNDVPLFVGTPGKGMLGATLQTDKGTLEVELDRQNMPATVSHFVQLARAGTFDGTVFFRLIPGAWVQGGDPANDGTGGLGWTIPMEVPQDRVGWKHECGTLSLSRGASVFTLGSQFFFSLRALPQYDYGSGYPHASFGRVIDGLDVLKQIGSAEVAVHPEESPFAGEQSKPAAPVAVKKVSIWVR